MRRRYLAVRIVSDQVPDEKDFYDAVWTSVMKLFGEYGASKTGLSLVDYDPARSQAILRCSHEALDLVKASIVAMMEIKKDRATVHIMLVSGTLKALRRKIQGYKTAF